MRRPCGLLTFGYKGGIILTVGEFDQLANATANFYANVTDPKASIISTFNYEDGVVRCYVVAN